MAYVLLFGLWLAACSNDLDALYGDGVVKDGGAPAAAVKPLPLLPALPDPENVAECTACAKQECAQEREDCLKDDDCRAMLACKGKAFCSNPACQQDCDALPHSAWFQDLWKCVFNDPCAGPCRSGENFACAGHYTWPVADRSKRSFPVTIHFRPELGVLVGVSVYICSGDLRCGDPEFVESAIGNPGLVESAAVDADNTATLKWPSVGVYDLLFEGERIGPFGWREVFSAPSPTQATDLWIDMVNPETLQRDWGGSPEQETRAPLAMYPRDCLSMPARGIRVEVLLLPDVKTALEVEDPGGPGPWVVSDVPEADRDLIVLRMVQEASGKVLSESAPAVFAGFHSHAVLWPKTF